MWCLWDRDSYGTYIGTIYDIEFVVNSLAILDALCFGASAGAYVTSCILGDAVHAVVSMPTGSGKSFVAELAVSQAVGLGWCLYLAPTNALTDQIRNDLRNALNPLGTEVLAFVGDQEYSLLKTNVVSEYAL